jgi:hypothetical protein
MEITIFMTLYFYLVGEAIKAEKEAEAEELALEQERVDMIETYKRLEGVVIGHLQSLRRLTEQSSTSAPSLCL